MLCFLGARTPVSLWYQGFGGNGFLRACTHDNITKLIIHITINPYIFFKHLQLFVFKVLFTNKQVHIVSISRSCLLCDRVLSIIYWIHVYVIKYKTRYMRYITNYATLINNITNSRGQFPNIPLCISQVVIYNQQPILFLTRNTLFNQTWCIALKSQITADLSIQ